MKHYISAIALALITIAIQACGTTEFASPSGKPNTGDTKPQTQPSTPLPETITSLTWYWQCASDPGAAPVTKGSDVVLSGEGSHTIKKDSISAGVPITISGRVCPPTKYPRDIIFVIDVSGSMTGTSMAPGTDRPNATTKRCGRIDAVETIISDINAQGGDSKFGIVTFSTIKERASTAMFTDKTNLFADIASGTTAESVLCAGIDNTSYGAGLSGAEDLLKNGRAGALKEVYFISDGEPTDGTDGNTVATRLKSVGIDIRNKKYPVQIATVMLGSASDTKLKPLASIDKSGSSLHAIAKDATKLAATLNSLAANEIDDGVIRYRPTGTEKWTEVALKPNMKGFDFVIPAFQMTPDTAPNGLDVGFEYVDHHNNKYSSGGNITWSVAP
jgi:hypothetical protein